MDWFNRQVNNANSLAQDAAMWAAQRVDRAYAGTQELAVQGAETVDALHNRAVQVISQARNQATQLFQSGQSTQSAAPRPNVHPKPGATRLDRANRALHDLNPLVLQGRAASWAGRSIKESAAGLEELAQDLDAAAPKRSKGVQILTGMTSAGLGFTGGLLDGIGGLADYGGRLIQGDSATLKSTGNAVYSFFEASAYNQAKVQQSIGDTIQEVGTRNGNQTLSRLGKTVSNGSIRVQSMVRSSTRQTVDAVTDAGFHYSSKLNQGFGWTVEIAGVAVDSQALRQTGAQIQSSARQDQRETANGLTRAVDGVIEKRKEEYRGPASAHAVTRDTTRVVAEIATFFVDPTKLGKTGRVAEAMEDASRLARTGERVVESERAIQIRAVERPKTLASAPEGPATVGLPHPQPVAPQPIAAGPSAASNPAPRLERYQVRQTGFANDPRYAQAMDQSVRELAATMPKSFEEALSQVEGSPLAQFRPKVGDQGVQGERFYAPREKGFQTVVGQAEGNFEKYGLAGGERGSVASRVGELTGESGFFRTTVEVEGRQIGLTTTAGNSDQFTWIHNLPKGEDRAALNRRMNSLYQRALEPGRNLTETVGDVGELHFLMSHLMPYERGSASAADLVTRAIFERRGIEVPRLKPGIVPDLEAFVTPTIEEYRRKYASMFETAPRFASAEK